MVTIQSIDVSKARKTLSSLMEKVYFKKQRFVIERRDIPMAVVIPIEDFQKIKSRPPRIQNEIKEKLKAVEKISKLGLKISDDWEKVEKEITEAHIPHR